jgi:hypothetical protein
VLALVEILVDPAAAVFDLFALDLLVQQTGLRRAQPETALGVDHVG